MPEVLLHYSGLKPGQHSSFRNRRGGDVPVYPSEWVRLDLERHPEVMPSLNEPSAEVRRFNAGLRRAGMDVDDRPAAVICDAAPPGVDVLDENTDANRARNAYGKILGQAPRATGAKRGRPKYRYLTEEERCVAERLLTPTPHWTRSGPDEPFRKELLPSASDWFEARRLNGSPYLTREEVHALRRLSLHDLDKVAACLLPGRDTAGDAPQTAKKATLDLRSGELRGDFRILSEDEAARVTKEEKARDPRMYVVYVDARKTRRDHKRGSPLPAYRLKHLAILHRIAELKALRLRDKVKAERAKVLAKRARAIASHREETGYEPLGDSLAEIKNRHPLPKLPNKRRRIASVLRQWRVWNGTRAPAVASVQRWQKELGVEHPAEYLDALIVSLHLNPRRTLHL